MSRYGVDYYGLSFYGPSAAYYYAAANFTAKSENVGYISLSWNSPYGDWSKIKLTRNPFGFPVDPWDGTELDIANNGQLCAYKETDPTLFNDKVGLAENTFYYYSLFIFKNDEDTWVRAGNTIALSAGQYNYTDLMYEYLPGVNKISTLGDPIGSNENQDLYSFLSLFGFQLNLTHTFTHLLVNRYEVQKVSGLLIPSLMQQLGLSHEPEIGYQQERILVQNAVRIFKEKGSQEGLKEFIKAYSGYGITSAAAVPNSPVEGVSVGKNLMLDYNDSSFEESLGHWTSADDSATLYCLKETKITKLELLSNVATLTIEPHNYQIGNEVYITGCVLPLFNSTVSPVTITARTDTTISFALTGTDVSEISAYNNVTESYPVVYPSPNAWNELTAPTNYPNKQKGILSVKNKNAGSGTVVFECGSDSPILKGVPVTAGEVYSFSIYSVSGGTARTVTPSIDWYDRFGTFISSSAGTGVSNSTGQFTVLLKAENKTAPTGAYYAVPVLSIASSAGSASDEWHYFDAAQFEKAAAATDFEEARQINVIVKANRINELANPHFNGVSSADPWTPTGATQTVITSEIEPESTIYAVNYLTLNAGIASLESIVTSDIVTGDTVYVKNVSGITDGPYTVTAWYPATTSYSSYIEFNTGGATTAPRTAVTGSFYKNSDSLELTATGSTVVVDSWDGVTTTQQCGVYYPSTEYTFSVYLKSSDPADTATLSIIWYDNTNTLISTSTSSTVAITSAPGGTTWVRPYVTAIAPSTAAYATVQVEFATTTGNVLVLDSALFENYSSLRPFFSGSAGPTYDSSLLWEGTPNASRSHYYKNYLVISDRLRNGALKDELLLGTTVALYYAQPQT